MKSLNVLDYYTKMKSKTKNQKKLRAAVFYLNSEWERIFFWLHIPLVKKAHQDSKKMLSKRSLLK